MERHVLLTGLSSPSNTSSFVNSLRQSFRVTSPALFCEDTESRRNKDTGHLQLVETDQTVCLEDRRRLVPPTRE